MTRTENTAISISPKTIGITMALFFCGVASGLILTQTVFHAGSNEELQEYLDLSNEHVWGNQTGWAEASLVIVNNGEKDVTIKKIVIHSKECSWSDMYYWKTQTGPVSSELESTSSELFGISYEITVDGIKRTFQQASSEMNLAITWTIVLYIKDPINTTLAEIPEQVTISVFTESKIYSKQVIIDTTFTFTKTEELKITGILWGSNFANLTVTNTGASALTISGVKVDQSATTGTIEGTSIPTNTYTLAKGATKTLQIYNTGEPDNWASGTKYTFAVLTAAGNQYEYPATKP
jgi:hypothetical protein